MLVDLTDAVDPAIFDAVNHQASHAAGVHTVTASKVRWLGHRFVADLTIGAHPDSSVHAGHQSSSPPPSNQ